jgi:hypothetical protein
LVGIKIGVSLSHQTVRIIKNFPMIYKLFTIVTLLVFSFSFKNVNVLETKKVEKAKIASAYIETFDDKATMVYNNLDSKVFAMPRLESFSEALRGFYSLKEKGVYKKDIITLIDFSLPSTAKRLWVIDLSTNTILFQSVVSHGMNSGGEYATSFSNTNSSNKSSLGFYATGECYNGKHGLSLKLDGLEPGVNSNARARAVVVHGADYANPSILNSQSYLGRSQGCPALPQALSAKIINVIKGKSCLFIYHPSRNKANASKLIS